MKKIYYILTISYISLLAFTGCKENEMDTYKNDPAIYFENDSKTQQDSIRHSFFIYDDDVTFDTVRIIVHTMGLPTKYDRNIKLIQTNIGEPNAAIAGTHFIPLEDPSIKDSICIRAGQVCARIPIVLLRDKSLESCEVRLELTIGENEYFRPGINEWRNFTIITTSMATKPNNWDRLWISTFGKWGSVKMKFIIESTGFNDFNNYPSDYAYIQWLGATAKEALTKYNNAHPDNPLCEANGEPVII